MFVRCDLPGIVAVVLLVLFFLMALSARAGDGVVAPVVAVSDASGGVDLLKFIQAASNLTVAGILWYYSRLFYQSNQDKDRQLLELTKHVTQVATNGNHLAANYESLVRELRPDARTGSGRIPGHNSG